VDLKARELRLPNSKTGAKIVHFGKTASDVLKGIEKLEDNPYVITGKKQSSRLTDLQHPWRRIRAKAKLDDVRIHDLRHSYASGALALGEGLPMIGKLLGHTQVQTTARYAHLANDPVKTAAGRVSDMIGSAMLGKRKKPKGHGGMNVASRDKSSSRKNDLANGEQRRSV
jgi:integrase